MVFESCDYSLLNPHDDIPVIEGDHLWFLHDDPVIGPILPMLFITVPVKGIDGTLGRDRIDCYPAVEYARISPVGIGHANEAEAGVPYYDDTFDEDDEYTTADISDPDGSIALGLGGMYYEEGMHYTVASEEANRLFQGRRDPVPSRGRPWQRDRMAVPGIRVRIRSLRRQVLPLVLR